MLLRRRDDQQSSRHARRHSLYKKSQIFMARGSAVQSAEQIVRSILRAYQSTTPSQLDDCIDKLIGYLADAGNTASLTLLVVEDADLLSRSELQKLLQALDSINAHIDNNLRVLLTSTQAGSELLSGMQSEQIVQHQVEEFRQPLLHDTEVASYIDARLLIAGGETELPLDAKAIQRIADSAGGAPGRIDQAATDALNNYFQPNPMSNALSASHWGAASKRFSKPIIAGLTLLLTGAAMAFFSGTSPIDREGTFVRELPIPSVQQPTALEIVPPTTEPTTPVSEQISQPAVQEPVIAETVTPDDAPTAAVATIVETEVETPDPVIVAPIIEERVAEPAVIEPIVVDEPVLATVTPEPQQAEPVIAEVAEPEPVIEPAPQPVETVEPPTILAEAEPETPAVVEPTVTSQTDVSAGTSQALPDFLAGVISGHAWIEKRDPNRFTIQLSAGLNERDLRMDALRNGMTNKTAIYRMDRDGKGWFSLIHGDFESVSAATNAIEEMPELWRKRAPWIRGFAGIQKAMVE